MDIEILFIVSFVVFGLFQTLEPGEIANNAPDSTTRWQKVKESLDWLLPNRWKWHTLLNNIGATVKTKIYNNTNGTNTETLTEDDEDHWFVRLVGDITELDGYTIVKAFSDATIANRQVRWGVYFNGSWHNSSWTDFAGNDWSEKGLSIIDVTNASGVCEVRLQIRATISGSGVLDITTYQTAGIMAWITGAI